jgi:hypothetical protein
MSFPHAFGGNPEALWTPGIPGQPGCPTEAFGHDG